MAVGFKTMGVPCNRPDRMPSYSLCLLSESPHFGGIEKRLHLNTTYITVVVAQRIKSLIHGLRSSEQLERGKNPEPLVNPGP